MHGESVVLRVLDRSNVSLDIDKLGIRPDDRASFRALIKKPNGIIINTGPTGSGKTTTLYAALNELNTPEVKILTAEDPVEYDIDGLIQIQINADIGLTFGRCLRSFLRQDPDIILIGEIRDLETAQISVQASLTGHLVFSTLHTNDAPSAIARLLDLGLEPFLITATLEAVVAQRLVRRICSYCKEEFSPTEELLLELELTAADVEGRTLYYGKGCDYCNHTGYKGRMGIFEVKEACIDKLGIRPDDRASFRALIKKPNGIIINTGPTGSGKTTTLYAALNELNTPEVKILTAEDPVEYDIDGLIQIQINADIGLTFGRCLRSFLRQDPDIILIGEIRDLETAQISVQASLTGHLVFSTLHTNDAPSAIARLLDLGLEPFLITATLEAVVAQRLVRRICSYCKEEFSPTEELLLELELTAADVEGRTLYYGKGCDYCNHTGYKGRMGIFEVMVLSDDLRNLIMRHASTNLIRQQAVKQGMRSLRDGGLLAIYDGETTIEEVVKETVFEEV